MSRNNEQVEKDEEELQDALGNSSWITYRIVPIKKVRKHEGTLNLLLGGKAGDTCIVCRCGWVMRFDKGVKLDEAEKAFMGHVQPWSGGY